MVVLRARVQGSFEMMQKAAECNQAIVFVVSQRILAFRRRIKEGCESVGWLGVY